MITFVGKAVGGPLDGTVLHGLEETIRAAQVDGVWTSVAAGQSRFPYTVYRYDGAQWVAE